MIVDPPQFLLQRLRRMRGGAEHTEAAGSADSGNHVAAMTESEQREVDT
jgi:hypothetical protein